MFSDPFAFIHILLVMSQPCAKIKNSQQSADRIVSRHRSASSIQSWKNSQVPAAGKRVLTDVSKHPNSTGAAIQRAERREFSRFQWPALGEDLQKTAERSSNPRVKNG